MRRFTAGLLLCLLAGCPQGSTLPDKTPASNPVADPGPSAQLLQIEVKTEQQVRTLGPKEVLRAGDQFALTVDMAGSGYVYVMRTAQDGTSAILYPASAPTAHLVPTGRARIPVGEGWLSLQETSPTDRMCLVFSAQPVQGTLPRCWEGTPADGVVERGGDDELPPPPPDKTDDRRGIDKIRTLRLPLPKPSAKLR